MTTSGSSKVARLITEYDLEGIGAELEARWTTETSSERLSLRDLADYFNRQLLQQAVGDTDIQPLDGEMGNVYRLLTGDDVSGADRTRARRRLERADVEVDSVTDDFVSYQAIRTYLTEHRDAEYTAEETRSESVLETVQRLRGRTATVVESKLEQLRKRDLTLGRFRVLVTVRVVCEDCGIQYELVDLIERGGCDCGEPE